MTEIKKFFLDVENSMQGRKSTSKVRSSDWLAGKVLLTLPNSFAVELREVSELIPTIPQPTDPSLFVLPSGEEITNLHVVGVGVDGKAYLVKSSEALTSGAAVGIAVTSAITDQDITIKVVGVFESLSLLLTPGLPVYVGVDGELSQVVPTKPANKFSQQVGTALSSTKILIEIQPSIDLP